MRRHYIDRTQFTLIQKIKDILEEVRPTLQIHKDTVSKMLIARLDKAIRDSTTLISDLKSLPVTPRRTFDIEREEKIETKEDEKETTVIDENSVLILHCERCMGEKKKPVPGMGGSGLAVINKELIKLPLDLSMFSPVWPERGIPVLLRLDNRVAGGLVCSRGGHLPWHIKEEGLQSVKERGGPSTLFTNQGWIDIDEEGIVEEKKESTKTKVLDVGELEAETGSTITIKDAPKPPFVCELCGKEFDTQRQLTGHMITCRKKYKGDNA